jgi:polar amino acid transport system substrate-binding protein
MSIAREWVNSCERSVACLKVLNVLLREASRSRKGRVLGELAAALVATCWQISAGMAQPCGSEYVLKEGDTLAQIATRVYGDPGQWTIIFYANQDRFGANESSLVPGTALKVPCLSGLRPQQPLPPIATTPAQAAAAPEAVLFTSPLVRRVEFLTADGYTPYTGRSLEGGGMLTQVISAAMRLVKEETKGRFDYSISWVNDWTGHLNPLLLTGAFGAGFPWERPDCDGGTLLDPSSQFRCQKFFFSDYLAEIATYVFVRKNSRIKTLSNEDFSGATLCRMAIHPSQELDQAGRNWLKDGKVTLVLAATIDECFRLLDSGSVDGVVEAELAARASLNTLGMADRVQLIEPPLALTSLHVVISKSHPQARTILHYINTALAKLRDSGEYERIVVRHLVRFWGALTEAADTAGGGTSDQHKSSPASMQEGPATPDAVSKAVE